MLPLTIWQQYNTVATPHGYEFQEPAYHYPPITAAPSVHMVYEPHGYTQTYEQMQAASSTSVAMLALPVVHSPSPTGHTPSPMGSPSSAVPAAPAYAFPQPPPPPPPAPNPPPHILPHPNPVLQRQRIPQTLEAGHTHSMVEFRVNGVLGIRVQDAIRDFVNIDEGEEQVLARIGARTIRLALHVCLSLTHARMSIWWLTKTCARTVAWVAAGWLIRDGQGRRRTCHSQTVRKPSQRRHCSHAE